VDERTLGYAKLAYEGKLEQLKTFITPAQRKALEAKFLTTGYIMASVGSDDKTFDDVCEILSMTNPIILAAQSGAQDIIELPHPDNNLARKKKEEEDIARMKMSMEQLVSNRKV
jgi:hypothetical protein